MKPCFHDVLPLLSMINHHIIHHIIRHIITTYQNSSQCKLLARQNPCNSGPVGFSVKINKNYSLSLSVSVSNSLSAYTWILINWFIIFESFWVWRKITNQSAPKMPAVKRLKNLPPLQTMSNIRHIYIQPSQLVWKNVQMHTRSRATATQRSNNGPTRHRHMVSRRYAHWWNNSFFEFFWIVYGTKNIWPSFLLCYWQIPRRCHPIDRKRGLLLFYFPFFWNFICKNYRFAMPWK